MELYDDSYYIERIRKGDTECFACLIDKYGQRVFTLIVRIVRNREDAEELAQDVFLKVFRHLDGFRGGSSFSTWLYRVAYNTAVSAARQTKREYLSLDDDTFDRLPEEAATDAAGSSTEERLDRLDRALEQLPPDERALVAMFYLQENTVADVAVVSGLSESNVKTKMHRIRKKLYVLLNREEE